VKHPRSLRTAIGLVAFALLTTSCVSKDAPLDWLRPAGPIARDIGGLWTVVFYAAVAVFFLVEGAIVFALIRFRERKGDTEAPKQTHGNTRLEITWTIIPALLLAALAVPTLSGIFALAKEHPDALRVDVFAQQWWWAYEYPEQPGLEQKVVTANELHIPTGRPVRLYLNSRDIIHSYWVPRLAGKQDVTPGRTNRLTIQADRPGEYDGTCVEFCGLSHANMHLRVYAHDPDDFDRWAQEQAADAREPDGGLAAKGKAVLESKQCVDCHTIRGSEKVKGTTAPDLTHFASRWGFAGDIFVRNERNLRRWLTDAPAAKPGSKMPAGVSQMGLTSDDITALIAYLQSLR
jgi:cytochrome c oxidase subunit II